ncbi:MAG: methyl-accepting chemotaxis protein [Acidobacteria bacterium]|nr:MAG: methyl-accepting chemotaxis protein [Acidobacteriota bacterium]
MMKAIKGFFQRLSIKSKLLLTSLAFALPFALLLYLVILGFNRDIDFVRTEIDGATLIRPFETLVFRLIRHERISFERLAGTRSDEELQEAGDQVDEALADLKRALDACAEGQLKQECTRTALQLEETWVKRKAASKKVTAASLIPDALVFLKKVGDTSKLVLDSDLDSYYVMEATVQRLPRLQQILNEVSGVMKAAQLDGVFGDQEQTSLVIYADELERQLNTLQENLAIALTEDVNFNDTSASLQEKMPTLAKQLDQAVRATTANIRGLSQSGRDSASQAELDQAVVRATEAVSRVWQGSANELTILLEARRAQQERTRSIALGLSIAAVLLAAALVSILAAGITAPLRKATRIATAIADGQLKEARESLLTGQTKDEKTKDEVSLLFQAMERMIQNLDSLIGQVGRSSDQVSSSAARIADSVHQLEATVAQQAASTSEVSTTSKEISSTVSGLAQTMGRLTETASEAARVATQGVTSLSEINTTMKTLLEATIEVSGRLEILRTKTGNINQVITAITKVANQTNLLSLNAAIEAEKAGEYGPGFAVVAREVRRLADQTAIATLEIEAVISEMQTAVREGVAGIETYTEQTRSSSERIASISTDLGRVIDYTQQLSPQFETVNQSMQTQSESALQISEAMSQLNDAAGQTREFLTAFLTASNQLKSAVDGLEVEVDRFVLS